MTYAATPSARSRPGRAPCGSAPPRPRAGGSGRYRRGASPATCRGGRPPGRTWPWRARSPRGGPWPRRWRPSGRGTAHPLLPADPCGNRPRTPRSGEPEGGNGQEHGEETGAPVFRDECQAVGRAAAAASRRSTRRPRAAASRRKPAQRGRRPGGGDRSGRAARAPEGSGRPGRGRPRRPPPPGPPGAGPPRPAPMTSRPRNHGKRRRPSHALLDDEAGRAAREPRGRDQLHQDGMLEVRDDAPAVRDLSRGGEVHRLVDRGPRRPAARLGRGYRDGGQEGQDDGEGLPRPSPCARQLRGTIPWNRAIASHASAAVSAYENRCGCPPGRSSPPRRGARG